MEKEGQGQRDLCRLPAGRPSHEIELGVLKPLSVGYFQRQESLKNVLGFSDQVSHARAPHLAICEPRAGIFRFRLIRPKFRPFH